jgi:hypothetical protein
MKNAEIPNKHPLAKRDSRSEPQLTNVESNMPKSAENLFGEFLKKVLLHI